jgi:hypothetical protein
MVGVEIIAAVFDQAIQFLKHRVFLKVVEHLESYLNHSATVLVGGYLINSASNHNKNQMKV